MKEIFVVDYLVKDSLGMDIHSNYDRMPNAKGPEKITRYNTDEFPQVLTTNGFQSEYPNMDNICFEMIMNMTDDLNRKYEFPKDTAVLVGSFAIGSIIRDQFQEAFRSHQRRYSPTKLFMANHDLINSLIAGRLKVEGISTGLNAACSSSMFNLYMAWLMIQSGETETALVGAVDAPLWASFQYYWQCSSAISNINGGTSMPFDKKRDGFLQGEGGTLWYLASGEAVKKLGLKPRAKLHSIDAKSKLVTMTAHDKTAEHQSGMIHHVLNKANLTVDDVSFFNAHATSTPLGDDIEYDVFKKVFNDTNIPIVSFKGHIGHTMSACGLIESAYGLEACKRQLLYPNYNLTEPLADDPRIAVENWNLKNKTFLKASFGFGGRTSIAVFESLE